jgi:hypothetical protein
MKGKGSLPIRKLSIRLFSIGLSGLLLSCAGQNASDTASGESASSATVTEVPHNSTVTGQDLICNAPTHFTEIFWEGGTPRLTFAQKPNQVTLDQADSVSVISNADGGRTYGYKSEESDITVFSRFYLDGTCLIQTLDSQDNVTVEVTGETRAVGAIDGATNPAPPAESAPAETATETIDAQPTASDEEALVAAAPSPTNLAMTCSGTIQNGVDFTAYFNHDSGFNRIEFLPESTTTPLTSTLSYSGKNSAGQSLWRGGVSAMADVTLVHLSTLEAQYGDRISVGYDGRWGQAICR